MTFIWLRGRERAAGSAGASAGAGGWVGVGCAAAGGGGALDAGRAGGGSEPGRTTANPGTACARICSSQARAAVASAGSASGSAASGFSAGGNTSVDANRRGPPADGGGLLEGWRRSPSAGGAARGGIGWVRLKRGPAAGGDEEIWRWGTGTIGGAA